MSSTPPELPSVSESPSPTPPALRSRWRWWLHLVILALFPLPALLTMLPGWQSTGPALTGSARGLLIVCGVQLALFGALFGVAWLFSRATRDELLLRWRGGFWPVPLSLAYSIALRFSVGLVVMFGFAIAMALSGTSRQATEKSMMNSRPEIEAMVNLTSLRDDPIYYWLTLTVVSFVLAGMREELWRSGFLAGLRALWPARFSSRGGQILGVAIAAVFFGCGHMVMGPLAVGMTALLGFGLGVIMVLHRSIWPAVLAHGFFNATTFALLPWLAELLPKLQK